MLYAQSYSNRKQVQLQYELKVKRPFIIGDPIRLRQILTILLRQAINTAPEKGNVRLDVFSHTDPQFVQFEIFDNGSTSLTGFLNPAAHGLDSNNEQTMELEIASRLIELHGGSIKVKHHKGSGNIVSVLLPRSGILNDHQMPTLPPDEDFVSPAEAAGRG
jgi:signal transduction histidine kinase